MELVRGPSLARVLERTRPAAGRRGGRAHPPGVRGARLHARPADRPPRRQARQPDPRRATASCSSTSGSRASRPGRRRRRGALGTPRYAAPEVLAGKAASSRSDVYGLAATLWALIAGAPPAFLERGRWRRAARVDRRGRPCAAALEPDPHLRLPTAEAFARALGEGLAERGSSLASASRGRRPPPAVLETVVRAAAGVFGATAASIAFLDGDELVYESAWGAGAEEIVGVRLAPGEGIAAARGRLRPRRGHRQLPRGPALGAQSLAAAPATSRTRCSCCPRARPGARSACSRSSTGSTASPYGPADVERGPRSPSSR